MHSKLRSKLRQENVKEPENKAREFGSEVIAQDTDDRSGSAGETKIETV